VEGLAAPVVQPADGEPLEQQEAGDQAGVDPQQQLRVAGVVAHPGDRVDPVDAAVDLVDPPGGRAGLPLGPEDHREGEAQGPLQPPPRVALVHARLAGAGHHQRVGGVQQQGPHPADHHGRLAQHPPGDAFGAEQPGIRLP
jgi:hypothetical protein